MCPQTPPETGSPFVESQEATKGRGVSPYQIKLGKEDKVYS